MKLITKKDIWGVVFSAGIGVVTYLTYKIGKTEGMIQANEENINWLNMLIEEAKQEQLDGQNF